MNDFVQQVENVYRKEYKKMWRSILAYSQSAEVASDSVSESFTQALRRGSEIRDIKAWVWSSSYRIARGRLKDDSVFSDQEIPIQFLSDNSLLEFLCVLHDLSEQQRRIISLRYVAQMKPKEIAKLIGTSSAAVRVQLYRAHKNLRKSYTNIEKEVSYE